jgi:enoyl-CoA hydratase
VSNQTIATRPGLHLTPGPIATITITNTPRMNAMTAAMWGALPGLLHELERDRSVRVIIVRGEGSRAFCAGADISEFDTARAGDAVHIYDELNHAAFEALARCKRPTVARIQGFCLGGGLGLALACDLRICDATATFAIPAAKLGIGYNPRWIAQLLSVVSPAVAKEILLTGRRFTAPEAVSRGLVTRMADGDSLDDLVDSVTREIAANAPLSMAASKVMIAELASHGGATDLSVLDRHVQACFNSADYAEGRVAFMDKRKPEFKGS